MEMALEWLSYKSARIKLKNISIKGISTGCQPKIQFNLTSISDSNESSSSSNDPADDEIENELDLTSYSPLSKQTEKEHQAWFYTNGTFEYLELL